MSVLRYDPEGGHFYWKVPRGPRSANAIAGTEKDGYVKINILRRQCKAHRLAWLFQTGDWPPKGFVIDHVNRNRSDNRWSNLRLASLAQNGTNSGIRSDNTTGHVGVYRHSPDNDWWQAKLSVNGKNVHVGTYPNRELAIAARIEAANRIYGAFSPHLKDG
jgi:hypothetical protein